jgi:hypothetical protein
MKTNHSRLPHIIAAIMLSATISLSAQVRIGGRTPGTPGSLLDLNSPTKGTVLFPHVFIDDLDFIPNSIGAHPDSLDVNYNLAGSIVFNTNSTTITGLYLWDGEYWLRIGTATAPPPPPNPYAYCSTLYAADSDNPGKTSIRPWANGGSRLFLPKQSGKIFGANARNIRWLKGCPERFGGLGRRPKPPPAFFGALGRRPKASPDFFEGLGRRPKLSPDFFEGLGRRP